MWPALSVTSRLPKGENLLASLDGFIVTTALDTEAIPHALRSQPLLLPNIHQKQIVKMPSARINGDEVRPQVGHRHTTAPSVLTVNGHFAPVASETPSKEQYSHGIQVIDAEKEFK